MTDSRDRRRHPRISTHIDVRIAHQDDHVQDGQTVDLSEGGVGVLSTERLEEGSEVAIEVMLDLAQAEDLSSLKTMAKVMWSAQTDTGAYVAGLQFNGPNEDSIARLRRFLATVKTEGKKERE